MNDAHCHFLSQNLFEALGRDKGGKEETGDQVVRRLGWDAPGSATQLADRWVQELDRYQVTRCALMASVPGDEASVLTAVGRHPDRLVGFFMVDPTRPQAPARVKEWLSQGLRCVCLFPAMHRFSTEDPSLHEILQVVQQHPGCAIFVHCGVLTVGLRQKLGLPSRFDLRYSNPIFLQPLAQTFPEVSFIVPHFGAGMLREALMLADLCPNVHLDTSSSNRWMRYCGELQLSEVFCQALEVVGSDRLLFGTDSSFFPRGWRQDIWREQTAVLNALEVDPGDQLKILGGNFDRIFRR